jgi:hypothetical protein
MPREGYPDFSYVSNQTGIEVSLLNDSMNFIEKVWSLALEDEKVLISLLPSIPIELEGEPYGDFAIEVCGLVSNYSFVDFLETGYQGDIGCSTGKSSGTTLLHLVCQQNIGDFRLRTCTLLRRWHEAFSSVSGFQDCLKIQSGLNKLSEWCRTETHCSSTLESVRL